MQTPEQQHRDFMSVLITAVDEIIRWDDAQKDDPQRLFRAMAMLRRARREITTA